MDDYVLKRLRDGIDSVRNNKNPQDRKVYLNGLPSYNILLNQKYMIKFQYLPFSYEDKPKTDQEVYEEVAKTEIDTKKVIEIENLAYFIKWAMIKSNTSNY